MGRDVKRKGEWARVVTNRGGSGGASPPAFTRTTITSKSPSEAVFMFCLSVSLSVTLSRAYKWN